MFSKRQKKIISLLRNQSDGITGKQLAHYVNVTDRTIRNDIAKINVILKPINCVIRASKIKGYYLSNSDKILLQDFCSDLNLEQVENDDRIFQILGILLFENEVIHISDLADRIYVSEQTLYRDLNRIQNLMLLEYSIDIFDLKESYIYKKINELETRTLFFRMSKKEILETKNALPYHLVLLMKHFFDEDKFISLQNTIDAFYKQNDLIPSSDSLYMLTWTLYFVLVRNEHHFTIQNEVMSDCKEGIVLDIVDYLKNKNYLLFNEDRLLLQNYMKTLGLMKSNKNLVIISEECEKIINEFANDVLMKYGFDISMNHEIYDNLKLHINVTLHRVSHGMQMINPMIKEVKQIYPFAYEIAMLIVPSIYKFKGKYLIDDEISYIAVYIQYYLQMSDMRIKTVIVSGSGVGMTKLLKQWMIKNFSGLLEITDSIPSYEINEYIKREDIDLIVSTVFLKNIDKQIAYVNGIPGESDAENIKAAVHNLRTSARLRKAIENIFDSELFERYVEPVSFEAVIKDLSSKMMNKGYISDDIKFTSQVIEREKVYSTKVNNSFMIPHPLIEMASRDAVAIAVLKQGLIENSEMKCVFLLGLNSEKNQDLEMLFKVINILATDSKKFIVINESNNTNIISNLIEIAEKENL